MSSAEIDELLSGPLVTWFISCLDDSNSLTNYEDLVDGVLLHSVFLQIDPEPLHDGVIPSLGNNSKRIKNLEIIVGNMKQFYEEELGHLLLRLPDTLNLGKEPESYIGDMKLFLLLLLGCAVQCPNKEKFITKIKALDVDTQLAIVECIKQVTDYQDIVITQDSMENVNMGNVFLEIKKLIQERNLYREKWRNVSVNEIGEQNDSTISTEGEDLNKSQQSNSTSKSEREENHHYAVELADWKSKVRKQRQELEEKTEALLECKEELEHNKMLLSKFKQENQELVLEARTAKSYRDELDAVIERAERADRLEMEVARYREKLTDIEFYKTRIEELRDDNKILMETREMFEEQLNSSRKRADKVLELEAEIIKCKQLINDMALERAADKEKYQELYEENTHLKRLTKAANDATMTESVSDSEEPVINDNPLSEQLTSNAQTRALKLELENRRLLTVIESLKENSFHESSSRVLELEKEKKKLSLKVESLTDNCERITQQNSDLELVCKQALEENKKLQSSLKNQKISFEKQQQDLQGQHTKLIDMEKNYETAANEKKRIQSLLESVQRRADDIERSLESANQKLEQFREIESQSQKIHTKCLELEGKVCGLEKERDTAQRDVHKCREALEEKDVALDQATNTIEVLEGKVTQLEQEIDNSTSQILRLQEIERSSKELDSRAAIDRETLETLQSNLVAEKLNTQQLYTILEKLGLEGEALLSLPLDCIVERIAEIPEVINRIRKAISEEISEKEKVKIEGVTIVKEDEVKSSTLQEELRILQKEQENLQTKLVTSQATSENLLAENAKLQVYVTTLESQSTSLTTQHTALQLANSQLVAEKEELLKERGVQQRTHTRLVHDQVTLQSLHEQLSNEYENLLQERETLKGNLRDVKNESRILRETCERLEGKTKALQAERDTLVTNAKSLNNLRVEHSKLKEDFRILYTNVEQLKMEYKSRHEDYLKNKTEAHTLNKKLMEIQSELSTKDERCSNLELQNSKLNQRCEALLQINSGIDNDRRTLMEHASALLNQYQDLFMHTLEDKEHFYAEEKSFADKLNHMNRQKVKLEEKIMEHYRNMGSCSTKKKGFGASLVRRVRKASSDLLNKNRRSWAEDSKQPEGKPCESESGGNDSDASADDQRLTGTRESDLNSDPLSLGHPGTRRTVYYTDDTPPTAPLMTEKRIDDSRDEIRVNDSEQNSRVETPNESRPFLIYNRVSAVINDSSNINNSGQNSTQEESLVDSPPRKDKASPVWYEYGCV
ncbi:girdin [Leptopilina boulardi]|uniref:girdin n=1 Tax=Leptopilina boulardi TaxID=63433 RepID=UPI0021F5F365|nr:girdin [Leptopilina boulardi]